VTSAAWAIARTGMAVVISKNEKRAAFVDLRPLFAVLPQLSTLGQTRPPGPR
jgi:hypothetical protein